MMLIFAFIYLYPSSEFLGSAVNGKSPRAGVVNRENCPLPSHTFGNVWTHFFMSKLGGGWGDGATNT